MKRIIYFFTAITVLLVFFVVIYFISARNKNIPTNITEQNEIAIGILTNDPASIEKYGFFADYLSERTGIKFHIEPVKDAGSFIEQIENHKIRAAFSGSASAYRLIKEELALPVARGEKDGISEYYSYIITAKNSPINSVLDLKNKRFAYLDINMSSGYYYPIYTVRSLGYDEEDFFRAYSFLGSTQKVVERVIGTDFDGGAVKNLDLDALALQDPSIMDKIRIISKGGPYPNNTFMASYDLDRKTVDKIKTVMLEMLSDRKGKEILNSLNIDRFIETTESDFNHVKLIMSL